MHLPPYLGEFSRVDLTVHQHLLLCAVRELEMETWRGLIDQIEGSKAVYAHRIVIKGSISAMKQLFGTTIASRKRHD